MEVIGTQRIWSFLDGEEEASETSNTAIRTDAGHKVGSYVELARKVAELQFRNRDHVLLFRGQAHDHKGGSGTTLRPTIFRAHNAGKVPTTSTLRGRFRRLAVAEQMLVDRYEDEGLLGSDRLARQRLLRWSIIQHYRVCDTPLLDVTHSLRIAASFASEEMKPECFVYVLAVPTLSGAITASAEAGLQIVRLLSACPPSAMRPHLQEGYLLGEYPEVPDVETKTKYKFYELDFGRRLLAKFRLDPQPGQFWKSDTFPKVASKALYPTGSRDPLESLMLDLKAELDSSED